MYFAASRTGCNLALGGRLRVASQNVAKRLNSSGRQLIAKVAEHNVDIVALQEITSAQADGWCALLAAEGYPHIVRGVGYGSKGGALLAARLPISPTTLHTGELAGPRVAAGVVEGLPIASVYFPTGSGLTGWSALYDDLMLHSEIRRFVLVGDFQMAVSELEISSGTFPRWRRDPAYVAMAGRLSDGAWRAPSCLFTSTQQWRAMAQ